MIRSALLPALVLLLAGCPTAAPEPIDEPPPPPDYEGALDWAVALAATRADDQLLGSQLGASLSDAACPNVFDDDSQVEDPEECPSYTDTGWLTQASRTRSGPCSTQDGYEVSGTWVVTDRELVCEEVGDTVEWTWRDIVATGFRFDWTGAGEPTGDWTSLAADGSIAVQTSEDRFDLDTSSNRAWQVDLVATGEPGPISGLLPAGTTSLQLSGSRGGWGGDWGTEDERSQVGHAEHTGATAAWTVEIDLEWLYETTEWDDSGCLLEPVRGSIQLVSGPPGDAFELVLLFDGDTACDGCGELLLDGGAIGPRCEAALELDW